MKLRIFVSVAASLLLLGGLIPASGMCKPKTSISAKLINSNHWGPARYTSARRQKQLLTMTNVTL